MKPEQRRVFPWKVLGIFVGLFGLAVAGGRFWLHAKIARKAEALERRICSLDALARSLRKHRPVLRGEALSGSAWEDYTEAFKRLARVPPRSEALLQFVLHRKPSDREVAVAAIESHREALALLRRGVRRQEAGPHGSVVEAQSSIDLVFIGLSEALCLEEAGRSRDAAELLLDLCQFNGDLGRSLDFLNEMWSWPLSDVVNENLKRVILQGAYSREELARLEGELGTLDDCSPSYGPSVVAYTARVGAKDFQNSDRLEGWLSSVEVPWIERWRYGFSLRILLMDAFDHYAEDAERFAAADGQSRGRLVQLNSEVSERSGASHNPVVRRNWIAGMHWKWRELQTEIRLLRAAVHYRATGEFPDLEDPLGTRLLSERKEGRLRAWSRGKDELTKGSPDWRSRNGENPLILEIPE